MIYIHDTTELHTAVPSIVLIGKFDGLHRGHQKLLREAKENRSGGSRIVMFTFSRPPGSLLSGRNEAGLVTAEEKRELAERFGTDVLIEYPFTDEVRHITAESFVRDILVKQLRACEVVAGPDCAFGYQRRGNVAFLQEHCREGGFRVRVVEKEIFRNRPVSSSRIREALAQGRAEEAEAMLGYPFGYRSEIVHGKELGRKLGFPTINQMIPPDKVAPAFGVYAAEVRLHGTVWQGIANVGVKPTVSGARAAGVETHIYDFQGTVYGEQVIVLLKHFIRPERRFESLDALKEQVEQDKRQVREYWRRTN